MNQSFLSENPTDTSYTSPVFLSCRISECRPHSLCSFSRPPAFQRCREPGQRADRMCRTGFSAHPCLIQALAQEWFLHSPEPFCPPSSFCHPSSNGPSWAWWPLALRSMPCSSTLEPWPSSLGCPVRWAVALPCMSLGVHTWRMRPCPSMTAWN